MRRALSTFESLMRAPAAAKQAQIPKPVVLQTEIASTCTSGAEAAEQERGRGPSCSGRGRPGYDQLTEQIMEHFAAADDVDVRALI
ncbi:hypothetical protein ACFY1B_39185 [Streptomyces mirabilis]|uniref:hypothetical protein n=2 Tax=Streptomyces TaxID=1883 RepID=UPI0031BAD91E